MKKMVSKQSNQVYVCEDVNNVTEVNGEMYLSVKQYYPCADTQIGHIGQPILVKVDDLKEYLTNEDFSSSCNLLVG